MDKPTPPYLYVDEFNIWLGPDVTHMSFANLVTGKGAAPSGSIPAAGLVMTTDCALKLAQVIMQIHGGAGSTAPDSEAKDAGTNDTTH